MNTTTTNAMDLETAKARISVATVAEVADAMARLVGDGRVAVSIGGVALPVLQFMARGGR